MDYRNGYAANGHLTSIRRRERFFHANRDPPFGVRAALAHSLVPPRLALLFPTTFWMFPREFSSLPKSSSANGHRVKIVSWCPRNMDQTSTDLPARGRTERPNRVPTSLQRRFDFLSVRGRAAGAVSCAWWGRPRRLRRGYERSGRQLFLSFRSAVLSSFRLVIAGSKLLEVAATSITNNGGKLAEVGPTSASFAWPELAEVRETSAPEPSLGKADLRLHLLYVL